MSTGRYPAYQAWETADLLSANLRYVCERIMIAGSLRRLVSEYGSPKRVPADRTVGDIEIVAIPRLEDRYTNNPNLFGEADTEQVNLLWERVDALYSPAHQSAPWGDKQRRLAAPQPGNAGHIPCDLFTATEDTWGYILALRTGPGDWNRLLVTGRAQGGLRPPHIQLAGGIVRVDGRPIPVRTEAAFFAALGLPYLPPHQRTVEAARALAAHERVSHG